MRPKADGGCVSFLLKIEIVIKTKIVIKYGSVLTNGLIASFLMILESGVGN